MSINFQDIKAGYQQLYDTCVINSDKNAVIDGIVNKILSGKSRYQTVVQGTNIPWYFVGIVHGMEGSANFNTHLHNGDPLTAKTVHVPKGRPVNGNPPFTWESSAKDALDFVGATAWTEWTIPGTLYNFEKYNGFGYRSRNINTPYLWSFSNQYTKGKFTADSHFDPEAVSKQCGAAIVMKKIIEKDAGTSGAADITTQIKALGEQVIFHPGHFHNNAKQLQQMLNATGKQLLVDGLAGRNSSDAYFSVAGKFLKGDPRI